jgi:hypothetical protein
VSAAGVVIAVIALVAMGTMDAKAPTALPWARRA